jgi:dTDP-4-dehydrorhamnose reductase
MIKTRQILVSGASGQLGGYLLRELRKQDVSLTAWSGSRTKSLFGFPLHKVNLADDQEIITAFQHARPSVIIHGGAISTIADCFRERERANQVNTHATRVLAELAAQAGARLLFISTDLVFNGEQGAYRETDAPAPLSVYGQTKAAAEKAVLAFPGHVVVRMSLLFGPTIVGRPAFFDNQVASLRAGKPVTLFEDECRTPLSYLSAARGLLSLAKSSFAGILHFGGPERLSRVEMGRRLAAFLGLSPSVIVKATRSSFPSPEPRARDVSLDSSRWRQLFPDENRLTWSEALEEMFAR